MPQVNNTVVNLLKPEAIRYESQGLINCLDESISSKFYNDLFSENQDRASVPALYEEVKEKHRQEGTAYKVMDEIIGFLERSLPAGGLVVELGGGIYQERSAYAFRRFLNYIPLDISYSSIERYVSKYNKPGIVADATKLPFKDNTIDCVFTHTFLEHPLDPEKVLIEIDRVLKSGGVIVHNDAWFCRWWQRYGIVGLKPFSSMSLREKSIYVVSRFTELPIIRISPIIARRLLSNILNNGKSNIRLNYKKLKPNYHLHLACDEDAASSIDPIEVVRFYESRGYKLVKELSFMEKLFYPNKYIALVKQ